MQLSDEETWTATTPAGLSMPLWPFVFLTILRRTWEARNGHVFRNETFCARVVLTRVCDDLVT